MPTLHVVTRVSAHPDDVEQMRKVLLAMIGPTRAEKGCRRWDLHQNCEDPTEFMFISEWESPEALQEHRHADHILDGFAKMAPMIEGEMEFQYFREEALGGD